MEGINLQNIILLLVLFFLLYLAIKFIKGILKLIVLIVLFFTLGLSLYNVFVVKKPISYEVNRYKIDFAYLKEASKLNKEAGEAISSIKKEEAVAEQIVILEDIYKRAESLEHSEEINIIHSTYINNLQRIITAAKLYNTSQESEKYLEELTDKYDSLDFTIMDVLFPKK